MTLLKAWQDARRRIPARPAARVVEYPETPVLRFLRSRPGRCPCCGQHLEAQGHGPGCLFGLRSNLALALDGRWIRNP